MVKVRQRRRAIGRAWLFYETLDGTNANPSFGRNLPVCTGCARYPVCDSRRHGGCVSVRQAGPSGP